MYETELPPDKIMFLLQLLEIGRLQNKDVKIVIKIQQQLFINSIDLNMDLCFKYLMDFSHEG